MPHPNFVPVSLRCSRTTQSSGVSGSASTLTALPLTVNAMAAMRSSVGNRFLDGIFLLVAGVIRPRDGRGFILSLNLYRPRGRSFRGVIPEIDIWRVASLMLKRYGDRARQESARHADELWAAGDATGEVTWLRIGDVIGQLANTTPPGPLH